MAEAIRRALAILSRWAGLQPVKDMAVRLLVAAILGGLAALAAIAVIGCLATALWLFVLTQLGPIFTPLIVAAAFAILAAILAGIAALVLRRRRRTPRESLGAITEAGEALALAGAKRFGTNLLRDHKVGLLLAAVIAGLMAGVEPRAKRRRRRRDG